METVKKSTKIHDLTKEYEYIRKKAISTISKYPDLTKNHPKFKVGNIITFWGGYYDHIRYKAEIIGFDKSGQIYLLWDSYWFPIRDEKVRNIKLVDNKGMKATAKNKKINVPLKRYNDLVSTYKLQKTRANILAQYTANELVNDHTANLVLMAIHFGNKTEIARAKKLFIEKEKNGYAEHSEARKKAEATANKHFYNLRDNKGMKATTSTTRKRKPTAKKQGVGSKKKTIRKHRGINQRTGKLKKGFKYGTNGKIVEVQTPAQKKRQTGSTHVREDKQKQALPPGRRTSKNGNVYYERRANRSDVGKLLGGKKGLKASSEIGDLCIRTNGDGSTTTYSSHGGNRPCPYGGRVKARSVSSLTPASLNGSRKKKPTAKQLEARRKFAENVRAGKYQKKK